MIDVHCHILPALDDGALSVDEALAMAKALVEFGYTSVCCTPHCIKGYYDLTPQKVREATLMLQADLDNADIPLELRPGMEYMLDEGFAACAEELLPLGATRLVLCEAPQQVRPAVVRENLELILAKGFVPLVAHPERTTYFYEGLAQRTEPTAPSPGSFMERLLPRRHARLSPAERENSPASANSQLPKGVLYHANLGSFTGYYGVVVQRKSYELLKRGVYSALASDLHNAASAPMVLVRDKVNSNPLLKKLAEFDGQAAVPAVVGSGGKGGQGELF